MNLFGLKLGAMDVCPFIPIKNISIEDCVELSKAFAQLLSEELDIPVYLYAESQPLKYRSELSDIRQGIRKISSILICEC